MAIDIGSFEPWCDNQTDAHEIFADRAYANDGRLRARALPSAVIHDVDAVIARVRQMLAAQALVTIDGDNHHITKTARIGEIRSDGLIYTVWDSGQPIEPDPYLKNYPWAEGLGS